MPFSAFNAYSAFSAFSLCEILSSKSKGFKTALMTSFILPLNILIITIFLQLLQFFIAIFFNLFTVCGAIFM